MVAPYVNGVEAQVIGTYAAAGIEVVAHRHLDLTDNESFARVPDDDVRAAAREVAVERPGAVIFGLPLLDARWGRLLGH